MTKPIMIKTLSLGDGQPKICVPLTGGTAEELFQEAEKIKEAGADLAEWRADFYENLSDTDRVVKTMGGIAGILSGIPLLFTIRTEKEGEKPGSLRRSTKASIWLRPGADMQILWMWKSFPAGVRRSLSAGFRRPA